MRTSTQFPTAVHTLLMIAGFPNIKVTSEIVAKSVGCNAVIVRNVFSKLRNSGLIITKSGNGKNILAKEPCNINLWDIYLAAEDNDIQLFSIHSNNSVTCPVGSNIHSLLFPHFCDAVDAMKESLSSVTLEQLLSELKELNPNGGKI